MKNKNYIMDFVVGFLAIALIAISAGNIKFNEASEIKDNEEQAGNPPEIMHFSSLNMTGNYATINEFPIIMVNNENGFETETSFCLDASKKAPLSSVNYSNPEYVDDKLSYIVKRALDDGVIVNAGTLTQGTDVSVNGSEIKYYAYQSAIHIVNGQTTVNAVFDAMNETEKQAGMNLVNDLVNKSAMYNTNAPTIVFGGPYPLTKVNGQTYYETPEISVNSNTTGQVINLTLNNAPTGAEIYKNGTPVNSVVAGDKIKIRVPEAALSNTEVSFTINGEASKTIYKSYKYTPDDEQYQPVLLPEVFETIETGTGNATITGILEEEPEPTYSITITKKDNNDNNLAGATLALYNGNTLVEQWVSTLSAKTINGLLAGNYVIREIAAPNGYLKSADVNITVDADHTSFTVTNTAVPEQKGSITVTKKDNDGADLAGATITLYNQLGTTIDSWTSQEGSTSHTFTDLPIGNYVLKETTTPVGYMTAGNINVTVTDGGNATANFVNVPTSVVIKKVDDQGNVLAGAHLQVINNAGTVVDEWDTDQTGLHTITKLPVGTYTIKETSAPTGFVLRTSTQQFTIQSTSETIEQVFTNAKSVVNISKKDTETGELIAGANLVINNEEGAQVASFITDGNVKEITGLAVGKYTLKETSAPDGYALNDKVIEFTVADDGQAVDVTMYNNKIVKVPSTSTTASKLITFIGLVFIIIGMSFTYFYMKSTKYE